MVRLGKFTMAIYDENYDLSKIHECCTQITDEQSKDKEFVSKHHIKDLTDCLRCLGCPEAKGEMHNA